MPDTETKPRQLGIDVQHDIAEAFTGKLWCYVCVMGGDNAALGVAEANSNGYTPIPVFHYTNSDWKAGEAEAERLNAERGIDQNAALDIIITTMRKGE